MRIVCVHQGYELYGSDRSFIESVAAMREAWPAAEIDVVLPRDGPIVPALRAISSRIAFEPLWVLRRRHIARLATIGLVSFVPAVLRAIRRLRSADLVYVNTVVILDYLVAARFFPGKALVHVHEIPDRMASGFFRLLLEWARAEAIFNSKATRAAYRLSAEIPQHVVYNAGAITRPARDVRFDGSRPLRLLMLGRINRIKGQDLLIAALASLPRDIRQRFEVRLVGGSFEDDGARERSLTASIAAAGLDRVVRLEPFALDPAPLYAWADVVTVPSRLPEGLGRVAIEAMAYGRPALVTAVGGLVEVVEDGVTGWLVPPDDAAALAGKLAEIVGEPEAWSRFAAAARARYEANFGERTIARRIQAIVADRLARRDGGRSVAGIART